MSYLEFSKSSRIQNLSNKDLKNLIRNNEYYSSCYIVIHEENFEGLDILNLSENKLTALKLPQWLTQKLISLKEILLKNPEVLMEEETQREDPRKNVSKTDSLKNSKKTFRKTSTTTKKPNIDFTYDEDNYLNPNSMKRPKEFNSDKIEQKKSGLLKFSYRRSPEVASTPHRKPEVIPRSDENDEENTYEPPPRHASTLPVPSKALPLPPPPPPEDLADEYELPPRFEPKQIEPIDPIDYDYIETHKDEKPQKRKKSIFYIDSDFPPPFPDEPIPRRTENTKTIGYSLYMNTNESHTKTVSNGGHHLRPSSARRPLPPLPSEANHSLKKKTTNRVEYEASEGETPETETLPEYGNTTELIEKTSLQTNKIPTDKNDFLNSLKSTISQRKNYRGDKGSRELQEKVQNRLGNREINKNDSRREKHSSKMQLDLPKPPNALPKHVQSTYFGEDNGEEDESSENLPDYCNTDETKTKQTTSKTQQSLLAQEITMTKLKPSKSKTGFGNLSDKRIDVQEKRTPAKQPVSWKLHGELEVDDVEDEQETLPEYGNTSEHTGITFKQTEKTSIQNKKSPIADKSFLNSLKTKINNRKSNPLLGDEGSREFQEKVQNRLGNRETNMNDSRNEQFSSKFQSNLPKPPNTLPKHAESTYFAGTCDYGKEDDNPGLKTESQLSLEISRKKLKPTTPKKEFQNIQEKRIDDKPKPSAIEQQSSWKPHHKSGVGTLDQDGQDFPGLSTPTENFKLDELADELRNWLKKRRQEEDHIEDDQFEQDDEFEQDDDEFEQDDEFEHDDYDVAGAHRDLLNFNNEPFYRNTDRKGAIELLDDLEDGAFLLRPSRKFFLSITIKKNAKYFNLGIERTSNNKITCGEGSMKSQEFDTFKEFQDYFEHSPLLLQGERGLEEVYLRKVLPPNRY